MRIQTYSDHQSKHNRCMYTSTEEHDNLQVPTYTLTGTRHKTSEKKDMGEVAQLSGMFDISLYKNLFIWNQD